MKGLTIDGNNTSYPFKVKSRKEARMNDNIPNIIIIPPYILEDKNISIKEKVLYALLSSLTNVGQRCTVKTRDLAGILRLDKRTVKKLLLNLEKEKYIDVKKDAKGGISYGLRK